MFRHASFPTCQKFSSSKSLRSRATICSKSALFFQNYLESFGGSELKDNWIWRSWTRQKIRQSWQWRLENFFGKWNRKVNNPRWSRITLRSCWATLLSNIYKRKGSRSSQTPHPELSGTSHGNLIGPVWGINRVPVCEPRGMVCSWSQGCGAEGFEVSWYTRRSQNPKWEL